MPFDPAALQVLLKAKSPRVVDSIFVDTFRLRYEGLTPERVEAWSTALEISSDECQQLFVSVDQLIRDVLYHGHSDAESVVSVFPADFHADLRKLLSKILLAHVEAWKENAAANQVTAPRLVDFDWRVDVKTSSNLLSRMSVPTVLVGMKVQDIPSKVGVVPDVKDVQFELSKEALQTMLDGLNKIRDQLGAIK